MSSSDRTRIGHLLHRLGFEPLAPLTPRREFRARRKCGTGVPPVFVQRAGQRRAQFIGEERRRIGDDVENLALKQRAVIAMRDGVLDELVRELDRLAHRHAEADDVFGVHGFGYVENGGRSVQTHYERAAVFVLFVVGKSWLGRNARSC